MREKITCRTCEHAENIRKTKSKDWPWSNTCPLDARRGHRWLTDQPWSCQLHENKEEQMSMPLIEQSQAYVGAFDFLNEKLFNGVLPRPMLCLTRNANIIGGYFSPDKWHDDKANKIHEIAINANLMGDGNIVELMHHLVHEMCHLWQQELGTPSRSGYHNAEWADMAEGVGLHCKDSRTGKRTGQTIGTTLVEGQRAAKAIALLPDEYLFPWMTVNSHEDGKEGGGSGGGSTERSKGEGDSGGKPRRSGTRSKFTCAICGLNAWAKPGASLICGEDNNGLTETV